MDILVTGLVRKEERSEKNEALEERFILRQIVLRGEIMYFFFFKLRLSSKSFLQ